MGVTSSRYKGFRILARPYQLYESKRWTVDLEIRRNGRRQSFSTKDRYGTEQEADAQCSSLARRIIDGSVPGQSVDQLRGGARGWAVLIPSFMRRSIRQLLVAGGGHR